MCLSETRAPFSSSGAELSITTGMGTGGFRVDTARPEAQAWFDYAIRLSHAFYHDDAIPAMRRAVAEDPDCSLCAWGEAYVLGPTLNYGIDEKGRLEALAAAERARRLSAGKGAMADALTKAMVERYQPAAPGATEPAFGQAMARIARANPDEPDLAVIAAHVLLIPVRRDDESGLRLAIDLLEGVLASRPDDTGAIHYYIHATEFDGRAEDAIPFAERLGRLAPAASHLVHMPAHTFFHAGRYQEAALANAEAILSDTQWYFGGGDSKGRAAQYYAHNLAFGIAGALMSGDGELSLKFARHAQRVWPSDAPVAGRSYPVSRAYVVLGRHDPDAALAIPDTSSGDVRLAAYRSYARGEAHLQKGDIRSALAEVRAIEALPGERSLPERRIAASVIRARAEMAAGRPLAAAALYEAAAIIQESQLSDNWDPPLWWYPVRRSVAAAYLAGGDFARAEANARASLAAWEHDPLAQFVLAGALRGQGDEKMADNLLGRARLGWRGDFSAISLGAI
jgi:tetratricopeptide (TPR) repeat protein